MDYGLIRNNCAGYWRAVSPTREKSPRYDSKEQAVKSIYHHRDNGVFLPASAKPPQKKVVPESAGPQLIQVPRFSGAQVIRALRQSPFRNLQIVQIDEPYFVPSRAQWKEIIDFNEVNRVSYVNERRVCNHFAVTFKGEVSLNWGVNACGLVIDSSSAHAYCVLIECNDGENLEVVGFEPQADRFVKVGSGNYRAGAGFILL